MKKLIRNFSNLKINTKKDYYKILKINRDADPAEIKKNFYELAK